MTAGAVVERVQVRGAGHTEPAAELAGAVAVEGRDLKGLWLEGFVARDLDEVPAGGAQALALGLGRVLAAPDDGARGHAAQHVDPPVAGVGLR